MQYTTYLPKIFYADSGKKYTLNSLNLNENIFVIIVINNI